MFISKIEIPWDYAKNPYEIHCRLWKMFPKQNKETRKTFEENRSGFLFCVEDYIPSKPVKLLLQSSICPIATADINLIAVKEFNPEPRINQRLAFILTANPIKTIKQISPINTDSLNCYPKKIRVPLIRESHQKEWLLRKLIGSAILEECNVFQHRPLYFQKQGRAGKLILVTFNGILRVQNVESLKTLLAKGIGAAKSFGCGLLLLSTL